MDYRKAYGLRGGGRGSASAEPSSEAAAEGGVPPSSVLHSVTSARTMEGGVSPSWEVGKGSSGYVSKTDWQKEQDDKSGVTQRRSRRLYQRFFSGIGVGGRLRFLTLTSSEESVRLGLDIHRSWRCLLWRLRRRMGHFEYIAVREVGDKHGMVHLHIVFRGGYIEQVLIGKLWNEIHHSPIVFIEQVYLKGVRKMGHYLAKYIAKSRNNRYWASYGWVFQGWVGWSKRVKRLTGHYPSREWVTALARLGSDARVVAEAFLLSAQEQRNKGRPGLVRAAIVDHAWGF